MSQVKTREYDDIEITDADGNTHDVGFLREWKEYTDVYGSDADGNQGVLEIVVEDDIALDIVMKIPATGRWADLELFHPSVKNVVNDAIEEWLVANPPEADNE